MHFIERKRSTVFNAADNSNNIRSEVSYSFGNWDIVWLILARVVSVEEGGIKTRWQWLRNKWYMRKGRR